MAQEWAKSFYKTAKWIKCRKGYIANRLLIDGGLCEECKKESGYILHHKTLLTPNNIDNPEISLNWDNLEYVCKDCHDMFVSAKQRKEVSLMTKLTEKQNIFIQEYLIDLNATQAAIRAGYSPKTANEQAARLLAKVSIKHAIDIAMAKRSRRTGISQDRVVKELARIAFVNPQDVIDPDDASVRSDAADDDLACIQSVKVKTSYTNTGTTVDREVKLNDKMKALELLGRHLGMFKDKLEVSGIDQAKGQLDTVINQMRGDG